jgi:hypothetical protein
MRIFGVLVFAGFLSSAAVAAAGSPSPKPSPKPGPTVAVAQEAGLVVEGHGFKSGESVTVKTTIGGQEYEKTVTADAQGRFTAKLSDSPVECASFRVSAVGSKGSRTVSKRPVAPPCGMQLAQ